MRVWGSFGSVSVCEERECEWRMEILFLKASTRTLKPLKQKTRLIAKAKPINQNKQKTSWTAMFISRMWLFHLSPICCLAGYATQKASWIPNSERKRLIPILLRLCTPVFLLIFHLLISLFPATPKTHWPSYLTSPAPSSQSLTHLHSCAIDILAV